MKTLPLVILISFALFFLAFVEREQKSNFPAGLIEEPNTYAFENQMMLSDSNYDDTAIYRIPVVVHVVYHDPKENLSDEQIHSQIEVLNEDFRRRNKDVSFVPREFKDVVADVGIEFYLATEDPEGNPTNGITRTYTESTKFATVRNFIKKNESGGKQGWPTYKYLNIWTGNIRERDTIILGYTRPSVDILNSDGVVINYKFFGRGGSARGPYDKGRTATHEVGHWLGLYNIWGVNDWVDDTPCSDQAYKGCPSYPQVSCGSSDMFMNFMDGVDDNCKVMFTEGQKQRMRNTFKEGGKRESFAKPIVPPGQYCRSRSGEIGPFINKIRFGNRTFETGRDDGYGNYTRHAVEVEKGGTYLIGAQSGFAYWRARLNWRFWIDYNQDGDFDDADELVYETNSMNIAKSYITIPTSAVEGETRMRIATKYGYPPTSCEIFAYGEVEDYTLSIQSNSEQQTGIIQEPYNIDIAGGESLLYPNPTSENASIVFYVDEEESNVEITLTDSWGKTIRTQYLRGKKGQVKHEISADGLTPGIYFVSVQSTRRSTKQKLIIN